jgi:hypothetical protein
VKEGRKERREGRGKGRKERRKGRGKGSGEGGERVALLLPLTAD